MNRRLKKPCFLLFIFLLSCAPVQHTERVGENSLSKTLDQGTIESLAPQGWQIYDKVLRFIPESLYEHINGRAEFYLAYNFVSLTFVSFEKINDEQCINVSVYDMGKPVNAFGVFSAERTEGSPPLELGREAYRSGANCYIWKGRYYVQVVAMGDDEDLNQTALQIARGITEALPDSQKPVWGLETLPHQDRIPHSEGFYLVDAMGLDFLTNIFTANYQKAGTEVKAFMTRRSSKSEAQQIVRLYTQYANQYGKAAKRTIIENTELTVCDMNGRYDVLCQKGALVIGVYNVENQKLAIQTTVELRRQIHDSEN
ncbi:MAG: hypothetical protein JXR73_01260 [Candidatus Omnitrophica bacterium]|nr:hypothetical protein [Candidatus Omnitrophota bacterium]